MTITHARKMRIYPAVEQKQKRVFKKIGGNLNNFNYFKHSRDCKKIGGCRSISHDKGIETSAFAKSGHHLFSYRKWMMPTTFFRVFKKIGGNLNNFNYFKHSRDCKKIGGCRSISHDKGIETSAFAKSGHHLFSYRKWMMPTTFFLTETT